LDQVGAVVKRRDADIIRQAGGDFGEPLFDELHGFPGVGAAPGEHNGLHRLALAMGGHRAEAGQRG